MKSGKKHSQGIAEDWDKKKPYWCLTRGMGFSSPERTLRHMAECKHQNESMSMGSRGLTKKQKMDAFRLRNK
jgi:hypothetical protein